MLVHGEDDKDAANVYAFVRRTVVFLGPWEKTDEILYVIRVWCPDS